MMPLVGRDLQVLALSVPWGQGIGRKIAFPGWRLINLPKLFRAMNRSDAVHSPIPDDVGNIGMLLARLLGKPPWQAV